MTKTTSRARYTLEFEQEAVRLVKGGQSIGGGNKIAGRGGPDAVQLGQGASGRSVDPLRSACSSGRCSCRCNRAWRGSQLRSGHRPCVPRTATNQRFEHVSQFGLTDSLINKRDIASQCVSPRRRRSGSFRGQWQHLWFSVSIGITVTFTPYRGGPPAYPWLCAKPARRCG